MGADKRPVSKKRPINRTGIKKGGLEARVLSNTITEDF